MRNLTVMLLALIAFSSCNKKSPEEKFDEQNPQADILTSEGIDSVLATFEQRNYLELDKEYRDYADPYHKFDKELNPRSFYVIKGDDIYRKIVGNFRIKEFLTPDDYYHDNLEKMDASFEQYWLVDPGVLHMMLELILKLDEGGYDKYGFHVKCSHRHPLYNGTISGASYSQHMFGRAIDIYVEDVNEDGKHNQTDKMIVYDILQDIVGDRGGLGLYPGTMSTHFDCRGHRARWDWP